MISFLANIFNQFFDTMNYLNHNLKTELQEKIQSLSLASNIQFKNEVKYLFQYLETTKVLKGILKEASVIYPLNEEEYFKIYTSQNTPNFESESHQGAFNYQFINRYSVMHKDYN